MVYSFRSFIVQTNDSIRQQLITALIQENLSLKQSLLLHDSFNSLKIDFVSLDDVDFDFPYEVEELHSSLMISFITTSYAEFK